MEDASGQETPADVVALFESANVTGIPYRDFSAARKEYRADMRPGRVQPRREVRGLFALGEEADALLAESDERRRESAAAGPPGLPDAMSSEETAVTVEQYARSMRAANSAAAEEPGWNDDIRDGSSDAGAHAEESRFKEARRGSGRRAAGSVGSEIPSAAPSWLAGHTPSKWSADRSPVRESLQHSREKVAARWFALRGVFDPSVPETAPADVTAPMQAAPLLAIYSVAGGVGKTSLAASLTRALAAQGERVLLVDTTQRGVLPFYLGARELRPEVVRTFAPPAGSTDQPIHLVSYGTGAETADPGRAEDLASKIKRDAAGFSRVVVDVASAASGTLEDLIDSGAKVLVPVTPEMNSVISLPAVRRTLSDRKGAQGKGGEPAFLLVQFDASQPLQLDVREVLQQQLGDQLLPFAVRRSPVIAEALAEGMTVIDYAPADGIAKDYLQLAAWIRALAEPAREGLAQARWSER